LGVAQDANESATAMTWPSEPTIAESAAAQSQPTISASWGANNTGWGNVATISKPPISSAKLPATSKLSWAQIAKCASVKNLV
jgi:hypothetical protein